MKRILVVLLVLSVASGVFAQQSGWGTMSGEAGLFTDLNFAVDPASEATADGDWAGDFWLGITWEKDFGPWSVTLPLRLERDYFGTGYDADADDDGDDLMNTGDTTAKAVYTGLGGNLTVEVPFWFEFNNSEATNAYQWRYWSTGTNNGGTGTIPTAGWVYGSGNPEFVAALDYSDLNREGVAGTATGMANAMPQFHYLSSAVGVIPASVGNAGVNVTYGNDDPTADNYTPYGFKFGFNDLFSNPTISKAGGYYHFMGGKSQLYVSRGAYATEWWRASTYVLDPEYKHNGGTATTGDHGAYTPFNFHWENIEDNGIAYRFFLMDALQIGISFAQTEYSAGNAAPFKPGVNRAYPDSYEVPTAGFSGTAEDNLVYDFLMHPVFGVKYDNSSLAVSAMVGLEIQDQGNPYSINNGITIAGDERKDFWSEMDVYVALGASYKINDQFKVNGDISVAFGNFYTDETGVNPPLPGSAANGISGENAIVNAGVEVSYDGPVVWAGLGFKVIDLLYKDNLMWGLDYAVGFNVARDGYGLGDENVGPWIGLFGHINGINGKSTTMTDIGLNVKAGWKDLVLTEYMKFSISAGLGLDVGMVTKSDNTIATSFFVEPVLDWAVFSNGSIQFKYHLGATDLNNGKNINAPSVLLDTNLFTTTFKWTL